MTDYRERYDQIYGQLTRAELQKGSKGLEELSLGPELFGHDPDYWLGFYTLEGLELALEEYGFVDDLKALGFRDLGIDIRTSDPDEQLLRLYSEDPPVDDPLVELLVRRDFLRPHTALADRLPDTPLPVLTVTWLLLQNPRAAFTARRPPLPGQNHPGLGVGPQVLELLRNICRRLDLAALVTVPSYFHNALFYSEEFRHFDPHHQGVFLAMCRDLLPALANDVTAASWALHWDMVRNRANGDVPFRWFHELMVSPIADSLVDYFDNRTYRRDVQSALTTHRFTVDHQALDDKLRRRGLRPFDAQKIQSWL